MDITKLNSVSPIQPVNYTQNMEKDIVIEPVEKEEKEEFQKKERNTEKDNERIKDAVNEINKRIGNNSEALFGIHEKTNRITIKIVDKDSKKIIKEFPPDKTLDMIAKIWELAGIMVDEKK